MKNNILFIAMRPSDFTEMSRAAVSLKNFGWQTHIGFIYQGSSEINSKKAEQEANSLVSKCKIDSFSFLLSGKRVKAQKVQGNSRENKAVFIEAKYLENKEKYSFLKQKLKSTIKNVYYSKVMKFLKIFPLIIYTTCFYFSNKIRIKKILKSKRPAILVLPEEIVGPITPIFIKVANELNIPSMILPYTIANQQEAFESLKNNKMYHADYYLNKIAYMIFKNWIRHQDGTTLVRLPIQHILAQTLTGSVPPDPWMMNSGSADIIAIENEAMLDYNSKSGIPMERMKVTGAIYDDFLFKIIHNKSVNRLSLMQEEGISDQKKLLIIGGCPDQSGVCPPGFEFDNIEQMCRFLADSLITLTDEYEIVLRPHPNYPEMGQFFKELGIKIVDIDTARLIAIADIYIAFASATIRWAISCGVPVINYDIFHYDYDDYDHIPGVIQVTNKSDFCKSLQLMTNDDDYQREVQKIKIQSRAWGMLDGKSTQRISCLMEELINNRMQKGTG